MRDVYSLQISIQEQYFITTRHTDIAGANACTGPVLAGNGAERRDQDQGWSQRGALRWKLPRSKRYDDSFFFSRYYCSSVSVYCEVQCFPWGEAVGEANKLEVLKLWFKSEPICLLYGDKGAQRKGVVEGASHRFIFSLMYIHLGFRHHFSEQNLKHLGHPYRSRPRSITIHDLLALSEKKPCRCTRVDDEQAFNIPMVGGLFVNLFTTWLCKINKSVNRNWFYTEGSFKNTSQSAQNILFHTILPSDKLILRDDEARDLLKSAQQSRLRKVVGDLSSVVNHVRLSTAAGDAYDTRWHPSWLVLWCFRHIRHIPSGSFFGATCYGRWVLWLHQWINLAFF